MAIRKGIVKANLIGAIISLPPALFYGTGIPACVIFINKNKQRYRTGRQWDLFLRVITRMVRSLLPLTVTGN